MPDFSKRSYKKELLDRDDIPFEDIKRNMQELDFINRKLGGHTITLNGFITLIKRVNKGLKRSKEKFSVLEIGCGGGDNLRILKNYCKRENIPVHLTGVDINPHCIEFARSRKENENIEFITSDYKTVKPEEKPDIIFCSLFCHHFNDEGVKEIFLWMKENSAKGFFINDLQRNALAYYSIKWLTRVFSKSYLVKNDAPLSVLRGFKRNELEMLNIQSSIFNFQLSWKWAFRWLLIVNNE